MMVLIVFIAVVGFIPTIKMIGNNGLSSKLAKLNGYERMTTRIKCGETLNDVVSRIYTDNDIRSFKSEGITDVVLISDIMDKNGITNPNKIYAGDEITYAVISCIEPETVVGVQ